VEVVVRPDFLGEKERFTAVSMSLDSLLKYDQGDTQEGSVEVGLFAEFFREMLDARYGCGLLRCLAVIEHKVSPAPHLLQHTQMQCTALYVKGVGVSNPQSLGGYRPL